MSVPHLLERRGTFPRLSWHEYVDSPQRQMYTPCVGTWLGIRC